jgi:hypothetical protein
MRGFDAWLVFRLARQPTWLSGFACVIAGFGTVSMLVTSHAIAAGPLAASKPGFTIGDPVTAVLLGVFVTHTTQPRRPAPGEAISRELTRRSR